MTVDIQFLSLLPLEMSAKTQNKAFVAESVNNILNSLKPKSTDSEKKTEQPKVEKKNNSETVVVPRGRPKSGKIWKTPKKKYVLEKDSNLIIRNTNYF